MVLRRGAAPRALRSYILPAVSSRACLSCAMPSWERSPRGVPRGRRAADCRGGGMHPAADDGLSGGGPAVPPPGGPAQACPLLERAIGICQDAHLSSISPDGRNLGGGVYPGGRVAEAVPLLEQAMEQSDCNGMGDSRRSVISAWGRRNCGPAAWRRRGPYRAHAGTGSSAPGTRPPGICAAPPRRDRRASHPPEVAAAEAHYQQALALADELGMRPLQAHCHRGLGTLYATTGQREQARAELSTAIEMYSRWR